MRIITPFTVATSPIVPTSSLYHPTGSVDSIKFFYSAATGSVNIFDSASLGSIGFYVNSYDTSSGVDSQFYIRVPSNNEQSTGSIAVTVFHTGSNKEPRFGIGFDPENSTDVPIKPLDILSKTDDATGTEIILRSSRLSGATLVGDSAGLINFTVESSSFFKYEKIETTGSVASIEAIVTEIGPEGAAGDLIFKTSNTGSEKSNPSSEVMRLTGDGNLSITGSVNTTSYLAAQGDITSEGILRGNNLRLLDTASFSYILGNLALGEAVASGFPLHVFGTTRLQGKTMLGSINQETEVSGSLLTSGSVHVPNIGTSTGENTVIVANSSDFLKKADIDSRVFDNPSTLLSRSPSVAVGFGDVLFGSASNALTASNNFTFLNDQLTTPNLFTVNTATIGGNTTILGSLQASASFDNVGYDNVVIYDTASNQFYYTGSYGLHTGAQGIQGIQGIQGELGPPGVGLQGLQGPAGLSDVTNISASGYLSASEAWIENNLAIGGISNVSSSIHDAATGGSGGPQGTQGIQGIQGTTGTQGTDGSDGGVSTFTNGASDRVVTATGTDGINGEANLTFDGSSLTVTGDVSASGDINCDNFTVATSITSVGDDVTIGDDLVLSSTAAKFRFNGDNGGGGEAIQYIDGNGDVRNILMLPGSNVVAIMNRAPDGHVEIRANSSTAGSSGEVTVASFYHNRIDLNVPQRRVLEVTSTTDGDNNGDIIKLGSTSTTVGKIYYYNSSGNWVETDADAESSSTGLIAVALGNVSSKGMLLKGMVTLNHDPGTVGDILYLRAGTSGEATSTAPSGTNDIVRVIGYCLDSSNGQIYFNPSNDFIKHS